MSNQNTQQPAQGAPAMTQEQQQQQQQLQAQVNAMTQGSDAGILEYDVAGLKVKLSRTIVRNYLTRGGGNVSDTDIVQFMQLCMYNQLNPFLNEANLVKYGSSPAQMVITKEAYMKRADACPHYQGFEAGIIVMREGKAEMLEGTFYLPTDQLVGGWAKVHRDDKCKPIFSSVNLAEYDKKQSTWNEKKSTMIRKVAIVQALREAFPAQLGALYTQEEQTMDIDYEEMSSKLKNDVETAQPAAPTFEEAPAGHEAEEEPSGTNNEAPAEDKEPATTRGRRRAPQF